MKESILVTGGTGYIGSHTVLSLIESGYDVIVLDNLSNSVQTPMLRIFELTGVMPLFIEGDIRDQRLLETIFSKYAIHAVIHFAGLKAVGESHQIPAVYYENNLAGTISLLEIMSKHELYRLVFSSSATIYGESSEMPLRENMLDRQPTSPYGRTKRMIEDMLSDLSKADKRWAIAILRYFNPVGAHESGKLGEDPVGPPNNLFPYISQVAIGKCDELRVFGNDYPTLDGTGVRDYIHVCDLAAGHINALNFIKNKNGINAWNLGTGKGHSVLEIIKNFESVCGIPISYKIYPRRAGDISACWADVEKAKNELGWVARRQLSDMVHDTWHWQIQNPNGYMD